MRRFSVLFLLSVAVLAGSLLAGCKRRELPGNTQGEARRLYDSSCAVCHGRDGRGGVPAAEGLPPPQNFRDAAFQASRTDDELKRAIREGKGRMPPFAPLFDDGQLTLLVAYIRGFNPKK